MNARAAYAALVLAALCSGISTATTKYALDRFTATDLLVVELSVATVALWTLPRVRRSARSGFRRSYLLLGLLEPGLAYALFNFGLERTSAADAAVLVALESVVIAIFAAAFLGERLSRSLGVGVALGVGGATVLAVHEAHRGASLVGDALLYTFAVARLPAARAGVPLNLIPVFGVLSAVVLLNERLVAAQLLGAALVVVGLGAAQLGAMEGAAAIESNRRAG